MHAEARPGAGKAFTLTVALFVIGLDMVGAGILIPVLPQLLGDPGSSQYLLSGNDDGKLGLMLLGALVGTYPLAQLLASPVLGQLSDRFGRRPVLLISLTGTCIGYALFALGVQIANIGLLFFARFLAGFAGGSHSVAEAVISDVSTDDTRTRNFGLVGASYGIGYILGPFVGAVSSAPYIQIGWLRTPAFFNATTPFLIAAALCLLSLVLVLVRLPETNLKAGRGRELSVPLNWRTSVSNILSAVTLPGFRTIFLTVFCVWSCVTVFMIMLPLFLIRLQNLPQEAVGSFFALCALGLVLSQALLVPALSKRIPDFRMVPLALVSLGVAFGLVLLLKDSSAIWYAAPLITISAGLVAANQMALLSRTAPEDRLGEFLGISSSVSSIAEALIAFVIGYLSTLSLELPVLLAIVIALAGAMVMLGYRPPAPDSGVRQI